MSSRRVYFGVKYGIRIRTEGVFSKIWKKGL